LVIEAHVREPLNPGPYRQCSGSDANEPHNWCVFTYSHTCHNVTSDYHCTPRRLCMRGGTRVLEVHVSVSEHVCSCDWCLPVSVFSVASSEAHLRKCCGPASLLCRPSVPVVRTWRRSVIHHCTQYLRQWRWW